MLFLQNRNNTDDFDIIIVKTISPKDDSSKCPLFLTKMLPNYPKKNVLIVICSFAFSRKNSFFCIFVKSGRGDILVNSISFKLLPKVHRMSSPPNLIFPNLYFYDFSVRNTWKYTQESDSFLWLSA